MTPVCQNPAMTPHLTQLKAKVMTDNGPPGLTFHIPLGPPDSFSTT